MRGLICVLIVLICVQSWPVEGKDRNRVQKWQQRTWKTRFGNVPRNNWNFDGPVKGSKSHRRNPYASAHYGGLSRKEIDLLSVQEVPNSYSNFHFRFDDPEPTSFTKMSTSAHRSGKDAKNVPLNPQLVQNFRMKRFAIRNDDDDDEPEHFGDNLSNRPFVFGSDSYRNDNEYPDDQSEDLSNDLADLDFVRDDETIDFVPLQAGPNQRITTVEENDPFPHAVQPPIRKNITRKHQYTLVIHHGDKPFAGDGEPGAAALWGASTIWHYWPLLWVVSVLLRGF